MKQIKAFITSLLLETSGNYTHHFEEVGGAYWFAFVGWIVRSSARHAFLCMPYLKNPVR